MVRLDYLSPAPWLARFCSVPSQAGGGRDPVGKRGCGYRAASHREVRRARWSRRGCSPSAPGPQHRATGSPGPLRSHEIVCGLFAKGCRSVNAVVESSVSTLRREHDLEDPREALFKDRFPQPDRLRAALHCCPCTPPWEPLIRVQEIAGPHPHRNPGRSGRAERSGADVSESWRRPAAVETRHRSGPGVASDDQGPRGTLGDLL